MAQVPKEKVKVKPNSVKAADPGIFFILYTGQEGPIFDCSLSITINVQVGNDPSTQNSFTSNLEIEQRVSEKEVECMMPFGDSNWSSRVGDDCLIDVDVVLYNLDASGSRDPNDPGTTVPTLTIPPVTAQGGKFVVSVASSNSSVLGNLFFRLWQMFQ